MVSAACLADWQTILEGFARELWVCRKRKETNGWKIKNVTGRFLVQIHPSRFVSKVVCPVPKIANWRIFFDVYFISDDHANQETMIFSCANTIIPRRSSAIIWSPECWKWHFRAARFQNFVGSMPPDPPRLMALTAPCSYSRLFFSNQLPTSNFIETPELVTFQIIED